MTPISDDRLAEIDDDMRQFGYVDNDMAAELLAEVHRLRDVPPEVAAAMERVRPRLMRVGNWHVVEHEATTLTDLQIIAAHFTTLFKKGS